MLVVYLVELVYSCYLELSDFYNILFLFVIGFFGIRWFLLGIVDLRVLLRKFCKDNFFIFKSIYCKKVFLNL